jgi:hypothetical protein
LARGPSNGITILPLIQGASEAIRKAIAQARSAGGCDLVILDGPAMPWTSIVRITALGSTQRKLVGVIVNELSSPSGKQQRGKQYA